MKENLFDIHVSESPRQKWIKKHRVQVQHTDLDGQDEDEFSGERLYPWVAFVGVNVWPKPEKLCGYGDTKDDALAALARNQGWKLWNEE